MNKKSTPFKLLFLSTFFAVPTLLSAQNYERIISDYLNSDSSQLKARSSESKEFIINNVDHSESLEGDVLQVQQTYNSIPIYNGLSTFFVKDNQVGYANENFVSKYDISKTKKLSKSSINKEQLAESLLPILLSTENIKSSSKYKITNINNTDNGVSTKLIYFPKDAELVLAMEFNFEEINTENYWHILVDIETKEILLKQNLTVFCEFEKENFVHDDSTVHKHKAIPLLEKKNLKVESAKNVRSNGAQYNVFALPLEAPSFGERSIVSEDRTISPDGWHNDGTRNYTTTRGNNVYAYENLTDGFYPTHVVDAGSSLQFNYPLDINYPLNTYKDAAITNLFYVNNKMHDIFYKFGFTESARNFQQNNYNSGGLGNDAVIAEGRKGFDTYNSSQLNGASFSTFEDGYASNMRMHVFNPIIPPKRISFNAPSDFVGLEVQTGKASFGPNSTIEPIIGDLVKSEPADGCKSLINDLTNKIAFIERGDCTFVVKVKNAQDAGAKLVIIYNKNSSDRLVDMSGEDFTINIPSALINYEDGQRILSTLDVGTTINLAYKDDRNQYIWIDSSFDNGIIIHEYGHGISNRLTGSGYNCLNTNMSNEQMGEGWSDFFSLMLTNRPGDDASVSRDLGTFSSSQPINGGGNRLAYYSPDFNVNNYTYGRTNEMSFVNSSGEAIPNSHRIGFVWATMLWDLHWKFAERYGYNSNVLSDPNSGSAKVLQLVVNGLKLQACNPTFVDGRDAILAADELNGGANRCMIWETFAKRGLGVNARAGVKTNIGDQVEDFTVPEDCELSIKDIKVNEAIAIYPNPAKNEVILSSKTIKDKVNIQLFDAAGRKVVEVNETISLGAKLDVSKFPNGVYIIKGKGINANFSQKLIIKK